MNHPDWSYVVKFLIIFNCLHQIRPTLVSREKIFKLKTQFLKNPLQTWMHRNLYLALDDLGISYPLVNHSLQLPRQLTPRLSNLFLKAMSGTNINIAILGGSISAGATLYKDNNDDKIYFYALQDWWNNSVKPITGSQMRISNFALGATGSDFYAYCLDNYVHNSNVDMIIWELSANDYHRFDNRDVPPTLPLELLTRNILRLPNNPALIYVHFFRGKDYLQEGECNNLEEDGANYISKYYEIPSVSWRKLICKKLEVLQKELFSKIFSHDHSHPSILGHAQMGFLLVHLFRKMFTTIIDEIISNASDKDSVPPSSIILIAKTITETPRAIYTKSQLVSMFPVCFTFNVPSDGIMPFNKKKVLRVTRNDGYIISIAHGFLVRQDKTRGLRTKQPNKELHLEINVPPQMTPGLSDWMILIGSYSNFGGAIFFLDSRFSRVIETEKYAYGSIVAAVATHVKPGKHILVMKSLRKGFFLSSVMLG